MKGKEMLKAIRLLLLNAQIMFYKIDNARLTRSIARMQNPK